MSLIEKIKIVVEIVGYSGIICLFAYLTYKTLCG